MVDSRGKIRTTAYRLGKNHVWCMHEKGIERVHQIGKATAETSTSDLASLQSLRLCVTSVDEVVPLVIQDHSAFEAPSFQLPRRGDNKRCLSGSKEPAHQYDPRSAV